MGAALDEAYSEATQKQLERYGTPRIAPTIQPADEAQEIKYAQMRQGPGTNALTKLRAVESKGNDRPGNIFIDDISHTATVKSDNITLQLKNRNLSDDADKETIENGIALMLKGLSVPTYQLIDILTMELTKTGAKSDIVFLSVDTYMERRGLKDRKEARKQLVRGLEAIMSFTPTWEERRRGETIPYRQINFADSWEWADKKKSWVKFRYGASLYEILKNYPVMYYPLQALEINPQRNPNSYFLLRRIAEHKNMNFNRANENILSVKTLLESAPHIPSYKEVMAGNRNLQGRIIEPFCRDMNALEESFDWNFCHSKGVDLTDEEMEKLDYETFKRLLVKVTWKDYPEQPARLERIEKARKEKQKEKKKQQQAAKKETE